MSAGRRRPQRIQLLDAALNLAAATALRLEVDGGRAGFTPSQRRVLSLVHAGYGVACLLGRRPTPRQLVAYAAADAAFAAGLVTGVRQPAARESVLIVGALALLFGGSRVATARRGR